MRKGFLNFLGLIIGTVTALAPQTAYAQGETWAGESLQQMVDAARWKFGIFRVNAALELLNVGYDSDIFYGYLDHPVPDFTLSAGLPIQVLIPASKKIVIDLFDSPQYMFCLDTKSERGWNNTFRGRAHFALERFYFQAGGSMASVRRRLSPELDINIREKRSGLDGLILWQLSRQMSLALIYGNADYDYGDAEFGDTSLAEVLNRKESFIDTVAYVQPNARIRIFLDGQYGTYTFAQGATGNRDARSYGLFGGLEFLPREGELVPAARVQGAVSLGYVRFDMMDPQFNDGTGLAGTVNLSAELLRRTTARVFFTRGFQFSIYSGATYYVGTTFGGGITRSLSRRTSLSYNLTFGRNDYPEDESGGGAPQVFHLRYTSHTAGLNLMLARNLALTLQGTIRTMTLDDTGQARNRNFIGLNLIYGYPPSGVAVPARASAR